jgi:short-subunit dehydrogenase
MTTSSKTAVVTGASSGIGAVYAQRLAARGDDLILVARRLDRLNALADKLTTTHGVRVQVLQADLGNDGDLARVEDVLRKDTSVHLLVNNAGIARMRPFAQSTPADSVAQIALNITALTRLAHSVLPGFIARNEGTLINVASILSLHALPISSVYSATKAYVLQFTRGLQQELADTGVRIQAVLPAATETEIWTEEVSGVGLSALQKDTVMGVEDLVDAALAGFDQGEAVTWPSLADAGLWNAYEAARGALIGATQTGTPAPRYRTA